MIYECSNKDIGRWAYVSTRCIRKQFVGEYDDRNLELRYKYNIISFIYASPKLLLVSLDYLPKEKVLDLKDPPLFIFIYVSNNFDNHSTKNVTINMYSNLDSKN